ncbi:hypothetical protein PHO31112_00350 [Pandoraea horticolens]|uniref:Uncharacterized protein n=1 Tax=Pandoraea horticolens TaxID=2508298 RepID=A0A5E4RVB8_9BURK|nr:hypothetical protein PHO31112_00350 [Pandoraea horticolens]
MLPVGKPAAGAANRKDLEPGSTMAVATLLKIRAL